MDLHTYPLIINIKLDIHILYSLFKNIFLKLTEVCCSCLIHGTSIYHHYHVFLFSDSQFQETLLENAIIFRSFLTF